MTSVDAPPLVLKANSPADILAMIPSIAGFEPRNSDESLPDLLTPWSNLPEFFEQALNWDDEQVDHDGAALLLAIQAPPMRDAAMPRCCSGRPIYGLARFRWNSLRK
jgi:hypothetical protein